MQFGFTLKPEHSIERTLALSSMRVFSTSFSLASTSCSVSLIGVTSVPSSCCRLVRSIVASRWTLPIF